MQIMHRVNSMPPPTDYGRLFSAHIMKKHNPMKSLVAMEAPCVMFVQEGAVH